MKEIDRKRYQIKQVPAHHVSITDVPLTSIRSTIFTPHTLTRKLSSIDGFMVQGDQYVTVTAGEMAATDNMVLLSFPSSFLISHLSLLSSTLTPSVNYFPSQTASPFSPPPLRIQVVAYSKHVHEYPVIAARIPIVFQGATFLFLLRRTG